MHKNSFSFLEVTIHSIIHSTKSTSTPYGSRFKTTKKEGLVDEKQQTFLFFLSE